MAESTEASNSLFPLSLASRPPPSPDLPRLKTWNLHIFCTDNTRTNDKNDGGGGGGDDRGRLRYNPNKVAAFVRRREMLTVFLEWAKKSGQLAMYVLPSTVAA